MGASWPFIPPATAYESHDSACWAIKLVRARDSRCWCCRCYRCKNVCCERAL